MTINPGDVICIESGTRSRIKFRNFSGTEANPVTVINCGGQVDIQPTSFSYGIKIENCDYVNFSGTGDTSVEYGFKISNTTGYGMDIQKLTNHFDLDHFEFEETGNYAIYYLNEPLCDSSANFGVFTLEDVTIQNSKFTNCHKGIRIGHPEFGIGVNNSSCGTLWPHAVENLSITNIEFDTISGGDAIRLYGTKGIVTKNAISEVNGRGITVGTHSEIEFSNNYVMSTEDEGFRGLGSGSYLIHNNLFYDNGDASHEAIEVAFESPTNGSIDNHLDFINNTIVNPSQHGFSVINAENATDTNAVRNNLIVAPGASYLQISDTSNFEIANNHFSDSIETIHFVDAGNLDFKLTSESPVINQGTHPISTVDIKGDVRDLAGQVDIGANEYVPERIAYFDQISLQGLYVNDFKYILGDVSAVTDLLEYALDSGYNYLLFYNLTYINNNLYDITDPTESLVFADFIERAKTEYGIVQIGVVGETNGSFDKVEDFNNLYNSNWYQTVDVLNLEFEFWANTSGTAFTYYCSNYLTPNSLPCTNAGAFTFSQAEMNAIDQRADAMGCISEIYLGSPTNQQMADISEVTDRVLLHCYRSSDTYNNGNSIYNYKTYRLEEVADSYRKPAVMPIFSSRNNHMGPWLESHSIIQPMDSWLNGQNSYDDDTSNVQDVQIAGFQWYRYTDMITSGNKSSSQNDGGQIEDGQNEDIEPIQENEKLFLVYPNPFSDITKVSFGYDLNGEFDVKVLNTIGAEVLTQTNLSGTSLELQRGRLERGSYFLIIENNSTGQRVYSEKLVIN